MIKHLENRIWQRYVVSCYGLILVYDTEQPETTEQSILPTRSGATSNERRTNVNFIEINVLRFRML